MGTKFWVKRFLAVFVGAFVIIGATQWLKGHDLPYSVTQAGIWAAISATIFTIARLYQSGRGQHCAICKDTPEMQQADRGGDA